MADIKFGTSGWRGVLAEDFTFANARRVCQGIAEYLKKEGLASRGVVIGYDTRFRSEAFALTAAVVGQAPGIQASESREQMGVGDQAAGEPSASMRERSAVRLACWMSMPTGRPDSSRSSTTPSVTSTASAPGRDASSM